MDYFVWFTIFVSFFSKIVFCIQKPRECFLFKMLALISHKPESPKAITTKIKHPLQNFSCTWKIALGGYPKLRKSVHNGWNLTVKYHACKGNSFHNFLAIYRITWVCPSMQQKAGMTIYLNYRISHLHYATAVGLWPLKNNFSLTC